MPMRPYLVQLSVSNLSGLQIGPVQEKIASSCFLTANTAMHLTRHRRVNIPSETIHQQLSAGR